MKAFCFIVVTQKRIKLLEFFLLILDRYMSENSEKKNSDIDFIKEFFVPHKL